MGLLLRRCGGRGSGCRHRTPAGGGPGGLKSLRLFFAVWPPETVRQRLWRSLAPLREALPAVRWIPPERLHITLRFMGDVSPEHVPRLLSAAEALGEVDRFEVGLAGTGTFPRRGPARVYWVGVRGRPLVHLREGLDFTLAREGVEREDRTFKPHLTVGRASRGRRGGDRSRVPADFTVPELAFTVGAIHLVRSDLLPGGPRYANVHRAILGTGRE
ncbi:MAG: RNA 2',3'-cyclic phosphodiesterase [Gemmatimonadetes bacterium]|nr:RNA 2',3'-cyclic phosphodiesterase [Gemmatimonadota bacterium]MYB99996.1 RNA 2',3'-cyclic phosphodiesterase [Gemmatimonadota bacterium]MYI47287.1 RNA 2',3'-cyclic phosphodiesterase [Gemmatimonadota bacterium]